MEVIRLLQQASNHNLNQFVMQIVMKMTERMTIESFEFATNAMQNIICNEKYMRHSCDDDNNTNNTTTIANCNIVEFPLCRLPVDIIKNTSLFLNEKDVFQFEKCCRLFYQMINNSGYLKQTNNFKTFEITDDLLCKMANPKYSFYKYTQSQTLKMNLIDSFNSQARSKWQQVRYRYIQNNNNNSNDNNIINYDPWFTTLFKSIQSLKLDGYATEILLDKLPLQLLFNPQSNFKTLSIETMLSQDCIVKFEQQYLNLKQSYQQKGTKVKKLQCLEIRVVFSPIKGPRFIETEHLLLHGYSTDLPLQGLFGGISTLTCIWDFPIKKCTKINCNINTLRLIDFESRSHDYICVNSNVIEALNLHKNLVNLTLNVDTRDNYHVLDTRTNWIKPIEVILSKRYYHNLKNVNLLLLILDTKLKSFFDMLKKNVEILKHQFKQLNIGLVVYKHGIGYNIRVGYENGIGPKYYTIEWNPKMDTEALRQKEIEIHNDDTSIYLNDQTNVYKLKYDQWVRQWT